MAAMRRFITNSSNYRTKLRLTPARIILLGFFSLILTGTLLLLIPSASHSGVPVPVSKALFTSASAVCVTGLVATDTAQTWSMFGQAVILVLIQIGGLGFMSVTTIFYFIMGKKIGLSQRLLIVQSLDLRDIQGAVRLIRHVLLGTLIFEGAGALLLFSRFAPRFGLRKGLWMSVFHSVSAFCNAGFDIMGEKIAFSSLTSFSGDAVVIVTVAALVAIGGVGFFVWEDIWNKRSFKRLHLYSKLVLTVSLWLVVSGWILLYLTEMTNPDTIGNMPFPQAALASLFQSVMPRSGGFSVVNQAALRDVSKTLIMILMLIGGSAGSTAGGIKNATVGVLFLSAISSLRGKSNLTVYNRTIPHRQIINALSVMLVMLTVCFAGAVSISLIQPELLFAGVIFEAVSAVTICGLSHGITSDLVPASSIIVVLLMFFGRIGIMTFGMATFLKRNKVEKTKSPDSWILMG